MPNVLALWAVLCAPTQAQVKTQGLFPASVAPVPIAAPLSPGAPPLSAPSLDLEAWSFPLPAPGDLPGTLSAAVPAPLSPGAPPAVLQAVEIEPVPTLRALPAQIPAQSSNHQRQNEGGPTQLGALFDGAAPKPADRDVSEAAEFLQRFRVIRLGVPGGPGNGHQAASVSVMKRLRELGYPGHFEIVYARGVQDKLDRVLPEFDASGSDVQRLPRFNATVVAHDRFATAPEFAKRSLGVLGASDDEQLDAFDYKVRTLLTIQPYRWGRVPTLKFEGMEPDRKFPQYEDSPLIYALPKPDDPEAFIAREMAAGRLRHKVPGLQALAGRLGRVELMPAYGLTKFNGMEKLLRVIQGIDAAWSIKPEAFRGGVVIPFFSDMGFDARRRLKAEIDWDARLRSKVTIVSITDPDLGSRLDELVMGRILVVDVGTVARDVFEYLYSRATLPPLIAGANAQNLMKLLGRPFLATWLSAAAFGKQYPDIAAAARPETMRRIERLHRHLLSGGTDPEEARQLLGRFLLDAMDPGSEVSLAFRRAQSRPSQDKILQLLREVMKVY